MNSKLYVENLPATVTETSLRELFSQKGRVTEIKLMVDASTGRSNGRAYVTMATPELAETALKSLHSHSIGGRNIVVNEARQPAETATGLIGHGFEVGASRPERAQTRSGRKPPHGKGRRSPRKSR